MNETSPSPEYLPVDFDKLTNLIVASTYPDGLDKNECVDIKLGRMLLSDADRVLFPVAMPKLPKTWLIGEVDTGYALVFKTASAADRFYGYYFERENDGSFQVFRGPSFDPTVGVHFGHTLFDEKTIESVDNEVMAIGAVRLIQNICEKVDSQREAAKKFPLARILGRIGIGPRKHIDF